MDILKIKITQKEIDEMYDIEEDPKHIPEKVESNAIVEFEEFTINKDKEDDKKWRLEED